MKKTPSFEAGHDWPVSLALPRSKNKPALATVHNRPIFSLLSPTRLDLAGMHFDSEGSLNAPAALQEQRLHGQSFFPETNSVWCSVEIIDGWAVKAFSSPPENQSRLYDKIAKQSVWLSS